MPAATVRFKAAHGGAASISFICPLLAALLYFAPVAELATLNAEKTAL